MPGRWFLTAVRRVPVQQVDLRPGPWRRPRLTVDRYDDDARLAEGAGARRRVRLAPVRIGVSLPNVGLDHGRDMLLPVAEAADRLGFDSVWAAHHVVLPYERASEYPYQHSGTEVAMSPGMQWLDPLVTLAMCAGVTDRVAPRDERPRAALPQPGEPRRRGGRARRAERRAASCSASGRAGCRRSSARSGSTRPSAAPRTDEHIEVLRALWTEDPASFDGRFTKFRRHRARDHAATPRAARRSGSAATPTPACAARCGSGTAGTASRSIRRTCRSVNEQLARIGDGGRAATRASSTLSVVRGLIPPGREEESFVPDRRMLGGSAGAIVEELGAYSEQGVEDVVIQVSLLAPLVPEALGVGRGRGAAAAAAVTARESRRCRL